MGCYEGDNKYGLFSSVPRIPSERTSSVNHVRAPCLSGGPGFLRATATVRPPAAGLPLMYYMRGAQDRLEKSVN